MGLRFGELGFIRGIVYYKLSPHEQKPFAKAYSGFMNFGTRTSATVFTWLPVFIVGYLVYSGVEEAYRLSKRKNPADYINEVDPNSEEVTQ